MTYETPSAGSAVFVLPLPGPSFLPKRIMRIRITALECGAVRVTRTLREDFLPDAGDVVISREAGTCSVSETHDAYRAKCGSTTLKIDKNTGSITYLSKDGEVLLREDEKRPCVLQEKPVMVNHFRQDAQIRYTQSIDGVRASSEDYETVEARKAYACKLSLVFDPDEGLYGLGSHEEGYGNLRGKSRTGKKKRPPAGNGLPVRPETPCFRGS